MKFSDFVLKGSIVPQLSSTSKEGVILELVQALANPVADASGLLSEKDLKPALASEDVQDVVKAVLDREALGTTGIGHGYALPHAVHPSVERVVCAIGVSEKGVDFESLDRKDVSLFFLFLCPAGEDSNKQRLEALRYTIGNLRDEGFCRYLQQSRTLEDVIELLDEADSSAE